VHTPNIDKLAAEGVTFSQVFTTSPVCSPSRSALMTGMYQTSIGAHNHRSHRDDDYKLPHPVRPLTDYFREAGFFTANVTKPAPGVKVRGKTDLNITVDKLFDGKHWNQRQQGQPFYAQINLPWTHRKFIKNEQNPTDPEKIVLPPYYADHPITRDDWALYYDTIGILDQNIGLIMKQLEEEGLLEKTIIFFFGDNGRPHFRGKQWLYEGGIHVPLVVRWPDKRKAGDVNEELVSAVDITATSLHLAGIKVPEYMQGQNFLGPKGKYRDYVIAARDRCDETVDRIRCARTKKYKYIRNYYPERPYTQLNRYKESEYPVLRLMKRLNAQKKLTPEQALFFASNRPPEELYDLQNDPHEVKNLAGNPKFDGKLIEMRQILDAWIEETGDQGGIPEDPSVVEFYLERMKRNYDERIKARYKEENMSLELFK
jgi:arylsulfatase A-like enzyme